MVIRELIRIAMARIAPDIEIMKTEWFLGDNGKVTRKERYRFAVSGHITDDLIKKNPELNTASEINDLVDAVNKLSKYAHISNGTYNISDEEVAKFLDEIESAVIDYAENLEHIQERIQEKALELTQEALVDEITNSIPHELDSLSRHTIVENAFIEEMAEIDLFAQSQVVSGSGYTELELYYGSMKDGHSCSDRYPLTFHAVINIGSLEPMINKIEVDTSSFYE